MVLRLHGYGAWIESEGKPLEEYGVEVKDGVISCYVCSEEGKVRSLPESLWNPSSPLTGYVHKTFVLHLDDDGSHCSGLVNPSHCYGRKTTIKMDGTTVEKLWGDFKLELKSDGMRVGDHILPYIFAPVETTGLAVTSSLR